MIGKQPRMGFLALKKKISNSPDKMSMLNRKPLKTIDKTNFFCWYLGLFLSASLLHTFQKKPVKVKLPHNPAIHESSPDIGLQ